MTLPYERTCSVLAVREFLYRLANPYVPDGIKRIPGDVRKEARMLLRHYPGVVDMARAGEDCPEVFNHDAAWNSAIFAKGKA